MITIPINIEETIDHYNRLQNRKILEKKLRKESNLVKKNSMSVHKDFEGIDFTY